MKKTNQSTKSKVEANDEVFVVNGRVYRRNTTQKSTPTSSTSGNASDNESRTNQSQKVTNEAGCCWAFYLVVYVVVAAILAIAGAGVAALVWPLVVGVIIFIAGLIVYCFKG